MSTDKKSTESPKNLYSQLKGELKLQINQHLYDRGIISREVYEQAKVKLVSST